LNISNLFLFYFYQGKTDSSLFPKAFIEEALKDAPGGMHIILTGTDPRGFPLMAISYRYSSKKTYFYSFPRCRKYKARNSIRNEIY